MFYAFVLTVGLSITAKCVEYKDAPLMIIKDEHNHYIKFLEGEKDLCDKLALTFSNPIKRVCGCSKTSTKYNKDGVRLRCAEIIDSKVYSRTTAIYYYYPGSIPACIKLRDHLMYKVK